MKFSSILFSLILSFSLLVVATPRDFYKKVVVIVPVYRELYSENIASLISALYNQQIDHSAVHKLDVWFVVNNTTDANNDVRIENQETVAFLKELSEGRVPKVRQNHKLLSEIAAKPISKRLNIHIVDLTTPGRPTRNIGEIRDIGFKKAMASISEHELDHTLVTQMDADTSFKPDFIQTMVKSFEVADLKFGLMTMNYDDQPDSDARVYKRKITTDYLSAALGLRYAYDKDMPAGGGPRITATARAMLQVGGIPHSTLGEDLDLITALRKQFPTEGRYLDNEVLAKYRARDDGYDAAIYKNNLNNPVVFGKTEIETIQYLNEVVADFNKDAILKSMYEEAYNKNIQDYTATAAKLKSLIKLLVFELRNGQKADTSGYPALLDNEWFIGLLKGKITDHGSNTDKIISDLTAEFPYYLSEPATEVTKNIAKMKAATKTLLQQPFLNAFRKNPTSTDYAAILQEKFPNTSNDLLGLRQLSDRPKTTGPTDIPKPIAATAPAKERIVDFTKIPTFTNPPPAMPRPVAQKSREEKENEYANQRLLFSKISELMEEITLNFKYNLKLEEQSKTVMLRKETLRNLLSEPNSLQTPGVISYLVNSKKASLEMALDVLDYSVWNSHPEYQKWINEVSVEEGFIVSNMKIIITKFIPKMGSDTIKKQFVANLVQRIRSQKVLEALIANLPILATGPNYSDEFKLLIKRADVWTLKKLEARFESVLLTNEKPNVYKDYYQVDHDIAKSLQAKNYGVDANHPSNIDYDYKRTAPEGWSWEMAVYNTHPHFAGEAYASILAKSLVNYRSTAILEKLLKITEPLDWSSPTSEAYKHLSEAILKYSENAQFFFKTVGEKTIILSHLFALPMFIDHIEDFNKMIEAKHNPDITHKGIIAGITEISHHPHLMKSPSFGAWLKKFKEYENIPAVGEALNTELMPKLRMIESARHEASRYVLPDYSSPNHYAPQCRHLF